jgi:ADP-ribosyl-[dinitrogen reductase] hydrolase
VSTMLERAQGCLLAHLAGDSLGSLVEFQSAERIRRAYPDGVRELADGGTWNTVAGQPTDDGEFTLALARTILDHGSYDVSRARATYVEWMHSGPFDIGTTTRRGFTGDPDPNSQSNGALMRVSPIGIFGARYERDAVAEWARIDASIAHPHPVCQDASALFACALAYCVAHGPSPFELFRWCVEASDTLDLEPTVTRALLAAGDGPPDDYLRSQGWVLIALQNAFHQLLHADSLEAGVIDSVMRGGDTDTNAGICGALLGAVHGLRAVPEQWARAVLDCRPTPDDPRVRQPRPERYWPVDALELAQRLVDS